MQAVLIMFLPAAPAETPFHSLSLHLLEGMAAGRDMMPPGEEHLSYTAEGKTEPWVIGHLQ